MDPLEILKEDVMLLVLAHLKVEDLCTLGEMSHKNERWRAFMALRGPAWQVLDVRNELRCNLRLVVDCAGNALRVLYLCDLEDIHRLLTGNLENLRELNVECWTPFDKLRDVLLKLPRVRFEGAVMGAPHELELIALGTPPFDRVKTKSLWIKLSERDTDVDVRTRNRAAAPMLANLSPLKKCCISSASRADAALVTVLLRGLFVCNLEIRWGVLSSSLQRDLASVLSRRTLTKLTLVPKSVEVDDPSVQLLCAALRTSSLNNMQLMLNEVDSTTTPFLCSLIDACAGHPTLEVLDLSGTALPKVGDDALCSLVGQALYRVLAADHETLDIISLNCCNLRDAGMTHVVDGLWMNTHLRELPASYNACSDDFEAGVLQPALEYLAWRSASDELGN